MAGTLRDRIRRRAGSPAVRLLFACFIGLALLIPLMMVKGLVSDRQQQAQTAREAITAGWGGAQVLAGPVLVVPFRTTQVENVTDNGKPVTRVSEVEKLVYISPVDHQIRTMVTPEARAKSIYRTVVFTAQVAGHATFQLPDDLAHFSITRERLMWDRAELRMGVSDARGLIGTAKLVAGGKALEVQPGHGPGSTSGQGYFAFAPWDGKGSLSVDYAFGVRGSQSLSLVPRGGATRWTVTAPWPSPSFIGGFLPVSRSVTGTDFSAEWQVGKLALGQPPLGMEEPGLALVEAPQNRFGFAEAIQAADVKSSSGDSAAGSASEQISGNSQTVGVALIEPVNLYAKVDRSVKYGALFILFTFLTYFLFEVVAKVRVASAEYLLVGAGLVLFFAMLLGFAEVIGFSWAYLVAGAAMIGLLTAYSAAVLDSWRRARLVGAVLTALFAGIYALLSLEAWSLVIGSVVLFIALAGTMYATRRLDWGASGDESV
ncbi:cell envelope integrity protein CreD [Novosphingobium sp. 1529]|uniref:cell envelope integrity protein CreD n=1 Tax=Novosphingobium sp. 1529 TaxID=3156424 RepID=UPI0033977ACB